MTVCIVNTTHSHRDKAAKLWWVKPGESLVGVAFDVIVILPEVGQHQGLVMDGMRERQEQWIEDTLKPRLRSREAIFIDGREDTAKKLVRALEEIKELEEIIRARSAGL